MARPEVTGKRLPAAADEADAFSIAEFCKRHRISPQLFYKFKAGDVSHRHASSDLARSRCPLARSARTRQ